MDIENIKKAEIQKYHKENKDKAENKVLSALFEVYESNIDDLLAFGFVYNYEKGWFVTKLEINGNYHLVWIQKQIKEDLGVRRYRLSYQSKEGITLLGVNDFYLYHKLTETYASLNVRAFLTHIHNVYLLNHKEKVQIEEKETFKQFVENEKSNG